MTSYGSMTISLGFCLIILLLAGCSSHDSAYEKKLDNAENLIDSMSQAVSATLDSVPVSGLEERDRNRVALLRARVQYEEDSLPTSDSLMAVTSDYFRNHGDRLRQMQSTFLLAKINENNGDYAKAMQYACEGADIAEELDLPLWQGRFAQLKAMLFSSTGDFPNSAAYGLTASRAYARDNSESSCYRSLFAAVDAAGDYTNMMDYKRSLSIIDSVEKLIPGHSAMDSSLRRYLIQLRIPAELHTNHPRQALDLLRQIKTYSSYRPTPTYILLEARALMTLDSFDRALPLVELAGECATSPNERIDYFESLKFIAINQGDVKKIDECNDSVNILNASIARNSFENDLSATFQNIIKKNAQDRLDSANNRTRVYVIVAIIVSVLLVSTLFIIRKRKKEVLRKDKELNHNKKELDKNKEELRQKNEELSQNKEKLEQNKDELKQKNEELNQNKEELRHKNEELRQKDEELKATETALGSSLDNLKAIQEELQLRQDDLTAARLALANRHKDMESKIEDVAKHKEEILALSESLEETLTKIAEVKDHCSALHISVRSALNKIICEYENKKGNKTLQKQILSSLNKEIEKLNTSETFADIEFLMNFMHDNVIQLLRQEFPNMKERDVRILTLNLAGWTRAPIARFLNQTEGNCATLKNRAIARIIKSSAPHRELFITKFHYRPDKLL